MRILLFILLIALLGGACKKDYGTSGQSLEFYVLRLHQQIPGKCQVDPATAELVDIPTIKNDDILSYNKADYQFKFSPEAYQRLTTLFQALGRVAFAVTVDKKVVYYGYYSNPILSSSCEHSIGMELTLPVVNSIAMVLGCPSGANSGINDLRNDNLILATLQKQGKLR
jgi:hypothetical protein